MKYIMIFLGLILLLMFGVRMFGLLSAFITTDAVLLALLFGGITMCMSGFWIESYQIKPVNEYEKSQRKKQMDSCRNAICLSMVVLLFIVASFI